MADTVRTRAALVNLLADNTTLDISAQDLRDFLISVFHRAAPGFHDTDAYDTVQDAVDAAKGTGNAPTDPIDGTSIVFLGQEREIDVPLVLYSGVWLMGCGQSSRLTASAGFVGSELIRLEAKTGTQYCTGFKITGIELNGTTIAAIQAIADVVGNAIFHDIWLNTKDGLLLNTYTRHCKVEGVYSRGPVNHILHLRGNDNRIERIDKEGGATGTAAGEYILVDKHTAGTTRSSGNRLAEILLEGTTSANKSGVEFDGVTGTELAGFWWEPTTSDGYALRINDSEQVQLTGDIHGISSSQKLKIDTTRHVYMEHLDTESVDEPWRNVLEVDASSTIQIEVVQSRRGTDNLLLDTVRTHVGTDFARQIFTDAPTGVEPTAYPIRATAQNFLTNPSFEAGRYQWTFTTNPDNTEGYVQSEVGQGLMGHFVWDTVGSHQLYQQITVPAVWVGRPLTLVFLAKLTDSGDGTALITPYLANLAGLSAQSGFRRVAPGSGWEVVTQTIIVPAAGTLRAGAWLLNTDSAVDVYLDEFCLLIGDRAPLNPAKFAMMEVGAITVGSGSSAPATGTWKVGDRIYNIGASPGGTMGWVCTTAGSPGTWKTFGSISA